MEKRNRRSIKHFVKHLECEQCHARYEVGITVNTCPKCGGLLDVKYDYDTLISEDRVKILKNPTRDFIENSNLWKYIDFLPHPNKEANIITLGEGGSPVIKLKRLSEATKVNIYAKYYGTNPTGTHKDLGMSIAVSMAKEAGIKYAISFSTGNAAASLATYSNVAGIIPIIIIRDNISLEKLYHLKALGCNIIQISGLKDPWSLLDYLHKKIDIYSFVNFINPYRAEGHKSLAYDAYLSIKEKIDYVVVPLGTGGGLYGAWKGFKELKEFGLMNSLPKMIAVQPEAVMHTVIAFKEKRMKAEAYGDGSKTIVQSLADSEPLYGATRPLKVLYESNGDAVAVSDEEVRKAILELGREGFFVEPAAASTLAALMREMNDKKVDRGDNVVLSLTGTGLKQPDAMGSFGGEVNKFSLDDLDKIVSFIKSLINSTF
jgi:threonine synthase